MRQALHRCRRARMWLAFASGLLCVAGIGAAGGAPDLVLVQVPAQAGHMATAGALPGEGCRIVLYSGGSAQVLTTGFASACDPAVSPDGNVILFAGQRAAGDSWQIWSLDTGSREPRQISSGPGDHRSPLWLGSLFHLDDDTPTRRLLWAATGHGWYDPTLGAAASALYSADLDGGRVWQITHNPYSDVEPEVLGNGRVVFSSRTGGDRPGWNQLAVNIDGTDLMAYSATGNGVMDKRMSAAGSDGRVYFIAPGDGDPLGAGDLAWVSQRRPFAEARVLCEAQDGAYLYPRPLADGGLLVSYRPDVPGSRWSIVRIDPGTGEHLATVLADGEHHLVDAQELTPRARPQGRSSVVSMDQPSGIFYCLSTHISRLPAVRQAAPGPSSRLRVIEAVPAHGPGEDVTEQLLGEVALEGDGSFHVELPARTPVRLELVDSRGRVTAAHHSWIWVMPREWRGCIGCHEDPEMAPPNVLAEAVVQPAVSFARPRPERHSQTTERTTP